MIRDSLRYNQNIPNKVNEHYSSDLRKLLNSWVSGELEMY